MPFEPRFPDLWNHIEHIRMIDTHEHIPDESIPCADTLGFFNFFEHYVSSDLVAAGMPFADLEAMRNPANGLADRERWALMAPWWPHVRTTGFGRAMREYMKDLFGIHDINENTVEDLSNRIRAARKPGWYKELLHNRAAIDCALVIRWPGQSVAVDKELFRAVPILDHYAMPANPAQLENLEKESGRPIHTLKQLMDAQESMLDRFLTEGIVAVKIFLAYIRTLQFDRWSEADAEKAFNKIAENLPKEDAAIALKPLQDFMTRRIIALATDRGLPIQIHTGLQEGNGNYLTNSCPTLLSSVLLDYPTARFDLFHAGYPYTGEIAVLAKDFPNAWADLCWIQAVSPAVYARTLNDWLDLIPANKILCGGGDSNYAEGAYGHCRLARRLTYGVLEQRIEAGDFSPDEASAIADRIFRENARNLFHL